MQPFSFFFLLAIRWGGGDLGSGRVRALNLTVPLGSGRVGSDNLGYGPGSGFSFEPVQTSTPQIKQSTGSCCSARITVRVQAVPELDKNKAQICCSERTSGTGYC